MTFSLWLRLYPASVLGILLLTELSFPFGPLRDWFQSGPYVAKGSEGWAVVDGDEIRPASSRGAARGHLGFVNLARSFVGELISCSWCTGAWVALFFTAVFVPGWDRLAWWPALWLASSATVVVLDRIAE